MGGFLQRDVLSCRGRQDAGQVKSFQRELPKVGETLPGRVASAIFLHLALFYNFITKCLRGSLVWLTFGDMQNREGEA